MIGEDFSKQNLDSRQTLNFKSQTTQTPLKNRSRKISYEIINGAVTRIKKFLFFIITY